MGFHRMTPLATEAKSNEITAIPKLLELLDLRGAAVSIDAMGCQKEIALQIVTHGGDYIFSLKGNQGTMHDEVAWWLGHAIAGPMWDAPLDFHEHVTKGHGRLEIRRVWCTEQVQWFADRKRWTGNVAGPTAAWRKSDDTSSAASREPTPRRSGV